MTIEPPEAAPADRVPATWTPDPGASDVTGPVGPPVAPALEAAPAVVPARKRRPVALFVVSVLLVVALALAGYLWTTTRAYQDLAGSIEDQARGIGSELAATRAELEGLTAELAGVRAQLSTAQARITALADEKAQLGDDRETQRQLVDYQQRVSEAAGTVASALDGCIRGQDQLIIYLKDAASYDATELQQFEDEVDRLCRSATDANGSLQDELAR